MFIGHIQETGKQALAGVGVTTPVILAISAFAADYMNIYCLGTGFTLETTYHTSSIMPNSDLGRLFRSLMPIPPFAFTEFIKKWRAGNPRPQDTTFSVMTSTSWRIA